MLCTCLSSRAALQQVVLLVQVSSARADLCLRSSSKLPCRDLVFSWLNLIAPRCNPQVLAHEINHGYRYSVVHKRTMEPPRALADTSPHVHLCLPGPQVLAHEINHGYRYSVVPCESFNGRRLHSLRHLAHLVDQCEQPFFNFGLEVGPFVSGARGRWVCAVGCARARWVLGDTPPSPPGRQSRAALLQLRPGGGPCCQWGEGALGLCCGVCEGKVGAGGYAT